MTADALTTAGAALLGAVVGAFGSYLVQKRLAGSDQKRRLVLEQLQTLQAELHTTSFMVSELVAATKANPDAVRRSAHAIIERASATQMPKVTVSEWHPTAARAVSVWEERILAYAMGTVAALDASDSATEMRLAREFADTRDENDDFGLEEAMKALAAAIKLELT